MRLGREFIRLTLSVILVELTFLRQSTGARQRFSLRFFHLGAVVVDSS